MPNIKNTPTYGKRAFETNYTTVTNVYLRDKSLSFGAKGMLTYFMSNEDGFPVSIQTLMNMSGESEYAVRKYFKALNEGKYLYRVPLRSVKGYVESWTWYYYTEPFEIVDGDFRLLSETLKSTISQSAEVDSLVNLSNFYMAKEGKSEIIENDYYDWMDEI